MNPSPESTALRALLFLALMLVILLVAGGVVSQLEAEQKRLATLATPTPVFVSPHANVPVYSFPTTQGGARPKRDEPEVRRAIPVNVPEAKAVPTLSSPLVSLDARRKEWSDYFYVPPGKRVSVSFEIGRIRIERNGVDLGTFFHPHGSRTRQSIGSGVSIVSGRMYPKVVHLRPGTETVRVMSDEEEDEGNVVLRWED